MPLRLLIVDDNRQFLEAARDLVEREGMTVVGVASTSADALRCADELQPDVALVDVVLGEESGLDLARQLARPATGRRPRVVLISTYAEEDLTELIGTTPAVGFLSKSSLSGPRPSPASPERRQRCLRRRGGRAAEYDQLNDVRPAGCDVRTGDRSTPGRAGSKAAVPAVPHPIR